MNKILQTTITISTIVIFGIGTIHTYNYFSDNNKNYKIEFDDQNTSIKTTLLNSDNITFFDELTIQNETSLSVTKKIKFQTKSNKEINCMSNFITGENCDEYLTVYIDYKNSQITFFILKDFDKQIEIKLRNDDLYALFTIDYYKTIERVKYYDGSYIYLEDRGIKEYNSDRCFCYDSIFVKYFTSYTLERETIQYFIGDIVLENYESVYMNDFVDSIIQNELKTYILSQLNNLENVPKAKDIWELSDSIIWKEFLKKHNNSRETMDVYLYGKIYSSGRQILDTTNLVHSFYYVSEYFNYDFSIFE